ncbi:MAG: S41 family peptidase [Acutalibacteraceae bacterium]|nr:S41 family peptidase [Oscillospiraceae bacterium]
MSKKISLGAAIGLIAIAIALTVSITMTASSGIYNSLLKYLPEKVQTYSQLEEIGNIIKANYYGNIDEDNLEAAVANGYVNGLNDKYSKFMSAGEYAAYDARNQGKMTGIGITYTRSGNNLKITQVFEGSPAQISGLKKGDVIVAFDGEAITKENYNEMISKFEGDKLSTVNLTYRDKKTEKTISIAKGYEAQSVSTHADNQIGYIKISDFYSTTASQVQAAVNKFVAQNATGIILDLRDNSSTNFEAAIKVTDIFVPSLEGTDALATVVDAKGNTLSTYAADAASVNLPIVVIVNENTLGGAELLACDLRNTGKASIVGSTTAGVGVMQKVFKLTDGSALLLSVGEILPYKGESYNGTGVVPDYKVEKSGDPKELQDDNVYTYAVSVFNISDEGA